MKRPQYVDSTWLAGPDRFGTRILPEPHAHAEIAPLPDDDWLADEVADYNDRPARMSSFWIANALLIVVMALLAYALPLIPQ